MGGNNDRFEGKNRHQQNNSMRLNILLSTMNTSSDKKSKGNTELKWYIRPEEPYTYVQKVPAKSIRIHILLKGMCNILQDRSYVRL